MKNILLTGCGGAPTINFVRSLRDADPGRKRYFIVGIDYDTHTIHRSECDRSYLCPPAKDPKYIPFLIKIIKKEKIDLIHTQPEIEVYVVGGNRKVIEETGCVVFMPKQETIEILRDKFKSYNVWQEAGLRVPKNIKIDAENDLKRAFESFKGKLWLRETVGAAGKGSLSNPSYELAKAWIDHRQGWGNTVAAEHLTKRTTTWQSLWHKGKLVVGQGRERIYWEMSNRTQSGVTGVTGTGRIDNNPEVADLAIKCILSVDKAPNGIFSVDFTYDQEGIPNPTEINIGKFFTTHHFITRAGCNMPDIFCSLAFGEYSGKYDVINPCEAGLNWIRGVDVLPKLITNEELEEKNREYKEILTEI